MPLENRGWLDQHQRGAPPPPVPAEPDPEHAVGRPEQRPGPLPLKHGELVTKNCVLSRQRDAGSSHATEGPEDASSSPPLPCLHLKSYSARVLIFQKGAFDALSFT